MLAHYLILKEGPQGYYDGRGQFYRFHDNGFYPEDPLSDGILAHARLEKHQVKILSSDHRRLFDIEQNTALISDEKSESRVSSQKQLTQTNNSAISQDQRNKGIGILEETEKVRTVVQNGDCSDGGSSEPKVLDSVINREQNQLLAAMTDGG